MLDLRREVVGYRRKLVMKLLEDAFGVFGSVQEVGIAECNVFGTCGNLPANFPL